MGWLSQGTRGWLIAVASLLVGAFGPANASVSWLVEGKLQGKPKDGGKNATDISGLACGPAAGKKRICLIADDESQGAQLIILSEGHLLAGEFIQLGRAVFGAKPLELDLEAVAYADGFFYVIGSHGRPRNEDGKSDAEIIARTLASRHLYRIDLSKAAVDMMTGKCGNAPSITESIGLDVFFKTSPALAGADVPLAENGLTIEGLAVKGDTLILGFRGPTSEGSAIVYEIPLPALFDAKLETGTAQSLALGRDARGNARGIRDLASVTGGYVGIAGPVMDPLDTSYVIQRGDYALFFWDGRSQPTIHELEGFGVQVKPEAVLPLELRDGQLRALLLFDGPLNGSPTMVQVNFKHN